MRRLRDAIRRLREAIRRLLEDIRRLQEDIRRLQEVRRRLQEARRRLQETRRLQEAKIMGQFAVEDRPSERPWLQEEEEEEIRKGKLASTQEDQKRQINSNAAEKKGVWVSRIEDQ